MESNTYDYLSYFILLGNKCQFDNSKISFPRSYKKLVKSIKENDRDAFIKYLIGWYSGSLECSWYDSHKIKDNNLYYGCWHFEVDAVAKRLGIDDFDLQNEQYYPYELFHFIEED